MLLNACENASGSDNFVFDEQAVNNPESGLEVVVNDFTWAVPWSW